MLQTHTWTPQSPPLHISFNPYLLSTNSPSCPPPSLSPSHPPSLSQTFFTSSLSPPYPLLTFFKLLLSPPPPLSQSTFSFVPLSSLSLLPIHPSPSLTCFLPCSHHIMSLLLPSLTFKNIFQQTYGWTTASSMRSILFWTKTHGILVPHSSTTCQTKVP